MTEAKFMEVLSPYIKGERLLSEWNCYRCLKVLHDLKLEAHFLAQVFHESNYLKSKEESFFYSEKALRATFGKYFKEDEFSKFGYVKDSAGRRITEPNKQGIANRAYANRMSNGDEQSGDGWRFRGRGYIQLTGRANYTKYGFVDNPDYLTTLEGAWTSAFVFWKDNRIDELDSIEAITRKVNGGVNGLEHRREIYQALTT